jgi:hypothetical protein
MINIIDDKAKMKFAIENNRIMQSFEVVFAKEISEVLKMQYESAAKRIETYNMNYAEAMKNYNSQLRQVYNNNLKRIMNTFGHRALNFAEYQESKSPFSEFQVYMNNYITKYVALKIVDITEASMKIINRIIKRGNENGDTNAEMAKKIRGVSEISTMARAKTIARTETHSAAMNAFQRAMKATGIIQEKEWISVLDSRTRRKPYNHARANGERVSLKDYFRLTGQPLKYPGDTVNGSAGNVINCRCNMLFFTTTTINRKAV